MQTILIPTNFSLLSFDCVPALCNQFKGQDFKLIFMHMFKLSDSITELLMLSKRSRDHEYISDDFYQRCRDMQARHSQIKKIQIEFVYGSTLSLFKNFIEANEVTHVLDQANCVAGKINKLSMDTEVLIKRSGLPVLSVGIPYATQTKTAYVEADQEELLTEISV
ncbi:hypothetical protein DJ568_06815 [Mucilaginibacter hurinus]|uniref:Universal stress protein n=1 Tax=Mucilaginibacter hurinus TaxID=2201324 RepID=A0A367GRB0_9SPHI|nr:hypothetical protein [Mucilaginibacter hurinus]RCH55598.1 hypothetical protein DJ568_06815 [Mucilaginibacter hurinus]